MSFRTKLLLVVLLTIFASVSVVAYAVTHYTQAAFEAMDAERTEALVAQFKKEFVQRGEEIAHQAKNIAEANFTERMAIDLSRPNADQSLYVHDAVGSSQEHGLYYVEFVNHDGVLISSAAGPLREQRGSMRGLKKRGSLRPAEEAECPMSRCPLRGQSNGCLH